MRATFLVGALLGTFLLALSPPVPASSSTPEYEEGIFVAGMGFPGFATMQKANAFITVAPLSAIGFNITDLSVTPARLLYEYREHCGALCRYEVAIGAELGDALVQVRVTWVYSGPAEVPLVSDFGVSPCETKWCLTTREVPPGLTG